MKLSSSVSLSPNLSKGNEVLGVYSKLSDDFGAKMSLKVACEEERRDEETSREEEEIFSGDEEHDDDEEEEEEEDDFSFVCTNPNGSPVSAEDVFQNGQIRPVFPLFNRHLLFSDGFEGYEEVTDPSSDKPVSLRPPLRKLFVEEGDAAKSSSQSQPKGPYCEWSARTVHEASRSPETCKKSNSTGFSKLWRFRELVLRSNSDGKDAFVFLNNNHISSTTKAKAKGEKGKGTKGEAKVRGAETKIVKAKKGKGETVSSAHERHYMRNRAIKQGDKHKSYLPYRQDLVGFFTNVNGLSKNVHPF